MQDVFANLTHGHGALASLEKTQEEIFQTNATVNAISSWPAMGQEPSELSIILGES